MRVQWALLARFAEAQSGTVNILGGSVDSFWVERCPAVIQAFFAVQFRFHESEIGEQRAIAFETLDPFLNLVGQPATVNYTPQVNDAHPEGWEGGWLVTGPFQTQVEHAGNYTLSIAIDGERRPEATIPFRVVEQPV